MPKPIHPALAKTRRIGSCGARPVSFTVMVNSPSEIVRVD
jgi:hypothetical protein